MAKKEKDEEEKKPKLASSLLAALQHAEQKNGKEGEYVSPNYEGVVVGVPLNNLGLMYLLDSNVLPISKMIKIAGPTGSNKSALGFDFLRMIIHHREDYGHGHYIENEGGKWSPILAQSIIGMKSFEKNFSYDQMPNSSEAQNVITSTIKTVKKGHLKGKVLGLLLDSLAGSDTEKAIEKVHAHGDATRGYSELALLWTKYFQSLSPDLIGLPLTFIFINHLKDKTDDMGNKSHGSPGGVAQDFYSGVIIWTNAIQSAPTAKVEWEVMTADGPEEVKRPHFLRPIRLSCVKTSFGTAFHRINVDFIWWFDEITGEQRSIFDWDAAAANLVIASQDDYGNKLGGGYAKLHEICKVEETKKRCNCKRLGLKDVSLRLLGEAIHRDQELMKELQFFFHIKQHKAYDSKVPLPKPVEETTPPPPPPPPSKSRKGSESADEVTDL